MQHVFRGHTRLKLSCDVDECKHLLPGDDLSAQGAARVASRGSSARTTRVAPAAPAVTAKERPNAELRPNATQGAFRVTVDKRRHQPIVYAYSMPPTLHLELLIRGHRHKFGALCYIR